MPPENKEIQKFNDIAGSAAPDGDNEFADLFEDGGVIVSSFNVPLRARGKFKVATASGAVPDPSQVKDLSSKASAMWSVSGNKFIPCDASAPRLTPGYYEIYTSQELGIFLAQKNVVFDDILRLPDSASSEVVKGIQQFWKREKRFRDLGFLWKRGILLWGQPGSGKTITLQIIAQEIISNGGIAVYMGHPDVTAKGLSVIRRIEPTTPIMVMIEDLDAVIKTYGESSVLAMLDGELQIDNVTFIATTNYPEYLDKRITNRPSRFDVIKWVPMPSANDRSFYIRKKHARLRMKKHEQELNSWVEATEGFSIAHIKELIISVEVFEVPFKEAVDRLQSMISNRVHSAVSPNGKTGFGNYS